MADLRPPRRWFQFSLGSLLLVMTLLAVWLSWQIGFIRERQAWLNANASLVNQSPTRQATIPIWRRLLGDVAIAEITVPLGSDAAEVVRIQHWFPEATIGPPVGYSPASAPIFNSTAAGWTPTTSTAPTRGLTWVAAQRAEASEEESGNSPASEDERRIREQRKRLMNTIDIPEKRFPTLDDPGQAPSERIHPLFQN